MVQMQTTFPWSSSVIWHSMGIELWSRNPDATFETIKPRTHRHLKFQVNCINSQIFYKQTSLLPKTSGQFHQCSNKLKFSSFFDGHQQKNAHNKQQKRTFPSGYTFLKSKLMITNFDYHKCCLFRKNKNPGSHAKQWKYFFHKTLFPTELFPNYFLYIHKIKSA